MKEKYNGWTNYATWRVNMEILGDIEFDEIVSADSLKKIVEDVVFSQYELGNGSHLVEDYARAFISQVNFYEIAKLINEELELQTKYDN
jgi:hypothetical protein